MAGILTVSTWPAALALALLAGLASGEAAGGVEAGSSRSFVIDSTRGEVQGVLVGADESGLASLGFPLARRTISAEGDDYPVLDVEVAQGVVVSCLINQGSVAEITSTSARLRDERGAGVGSTLAELKEKYPGGRLFVGAADARYASFVNGSRLVFVLDQSGIHESCFEAEAGSACAVAEDTVVAEIRITPYLLE